MYRYERCFVDFVSLSRNALSVMDLTSEQENFIKIVKIIVEMMPKHLRDFFITSWDAKFPTQPWANDATSGQYLYNAIPQSVKKNQTKFNITLQQMILGGDCETWDPSALFFVLLYAGLKITDKCRPRNQRAYPFTVSENIDRLRELRNVFFGHVINMSVPDADFGKISTELKEIIKDIFGTIVEDEIDQIINAQMTSQLSHDLKSKLHKEKQINEDFSEWIMRLEVNVEGMQIAGISCCFSHLILSFLLNLDSFY